MHLGCLLFLSVRRQKKGAIYVVSQYTPWGPTHLTYARLSPSHLDPYSLGETTACLQGQPYEVG